MRQLIAKLYHNRQLNYFFPTLVSCLKRELSSCESVLDLGCGPSSPLQYCTNIKYSVGVEAFKPYLNQAKKKKTHSKFIHKKISQIEFRPGSFDAIIALEVLEHMPETEGKILLRKAEKWAKKIVIVSSPNGFVAQKAIDDNPWQKHLSGWSWRVMRQLGYTCKGLAGLKILRQEVANSTMGDDLTSSIRFRPRIFWFTVASTSQLATYHMPRLAFELFSIKKIR